MSDITTLMGRLEYLVKIRKKTASAVAREIGITPGGMKHYMSGIRKPDSNKIKKLAHVLGVSPSWLQFGEGEAPLELTESKVNILQNNVRYISVPLLNFEEILTWSKSTTLPDNYRMITMPIVENNIEISATSVAMDITNNPLVSCMLNPPWDRAKAYALIDPLCEPKMDDLSVINHHDSIKIRKFRSEGNESVFVLPDNQFAPIKGEDVSLIGIIKVISLSLP